MNKKDYAQALINLETAEKLKMGGFNIQYNLGVIYNHYEEYDKAYISLKRIHLMSNSGKELGDYNAQLGFSCHVRKQY